MLQAARTVSVPAVALKAGEGGVGAAQGREREQHARWMYVRRKVVNPKNITLININMYILIGLITN